MKSGAGRVGGLFAASAFLLILGSAPPQDPAPPAPLLPAVQSIRLVPSSLTLNDGRDRRKVLVLGRDAAGRSFDLTDKATLKSDSPAVVIELDGTIQPRQKGTAKVTVTAAGHSAELPVTVHSAEILPVGFVRDIMPVISRIGCNAGTCHGAQKGRNGFKLSLRGYDPETDYRTLLFDVSGRRFNRVEPDKSLMLLKPTATIPHEGTQVIKPGSRDYDLIRAWITEGVKPQSPSARAVRVEILPAEVDLDLAGRSHRIRVIATYADGSDRDVTDEAICTSSAIDILKVKDNLVTGLRRGEAAVLVRYEGNYATRLVTIMGDRTGFVWTDPPVHNFIDRTIHAKLKRMKILPSGLCTDAEFVRRVTLDLTGMPPAPERTRAFLADTDPGYLKRARLIDALLETEEAVEHWTNKWADLLQCNSEALGKKGVAAFRDWIRQSIAANKPYDQFVRELLLAQGSSVHVPETNYYRVLREPGKITEDVSQTFLGVRFQCNKCHDHPFEKWTQNQYFEFGAYFGRVAFKKGTLGLEVMRSFTGDNRTVVGEEIVYRNYAGGEVRHPKTGMAVVPRVPFGKAGDAAAAADPRKPFVKWLASAENPLFAKALVNRVWSYFFVRGIIDPVDDIRSSNPPSNPALLDALADHFVKSGYDQRELMRTICRSRAYQLSIRSNKWNEDDTINFSHAIPRRLTAEQLLDAVGVATSYHPTFAGFPSGFRAVQIADGKVADSAFLKLFGRPERKSACECERVTASFTFAHTLNLINGPVIGDALQAPDNRIAKIVAAEKDDTKVIEEIYIAVLCRPPTERELAVVTLSGAPSRLEAAQDLAWALMNSPAFFFNR